RRNLPSSRQVLSPASPPESSRSPIGFPPFFVRSIVRKNSAENFPAPFAARIFFLHANSYWLPEQSRSLAGPRSCLRNQLPQNPPFAGGARAPPPRNQQIGPANGPSPCSLLLL